MARRPRPARLQGRPPRTERRDEADRGGQDGGLVVARLDRFGRSVQDSANLLARIREADGVLCTVAEGIDTSGYMGKFLADLFAALGELELARIRENWNTARKSAVARGIHVSGKVPTGYRRNEDRVLEPDPQPLPRSASFSSAALPNSHGRSWRASLRRRASSPRGATSTGPSPASARSSATASTSARPAPGRSSTRTPTSRLSALPSGMRRIRHAASIPAAQGAVRVSCRAFCAVPVAATR